MDADDGLNIHFVERTQIQARKYYARVTRGVDPNSNNRTSSSSNGNLTNVQMEDCEEEREHAMEQLIWEVTDSSVYRLDDFVMERRYGLDVAERIFCEAFIMRQDCRRPPNSMLSDFGSEHLRFAWFSFLFSNTILVTDLIDNSI